MAVPKKKTSKSRRDKRRAQHGDRGTAGEHLPAVQARRSGRIASARPAAPTRAARSSRSASAPRSAHEPADRGRRAGRRPRPGEVVAGALEAAADGIDVVLFGPHGPRRRRPRARRRAGRDRDGREAGRGRAREAGLVARRRRARGRRRRRRRRRLGREHRRDARGRACSHLRRLPGVLRPAIAVPIPTRDGPSVLIDAGANADSRPEHLLQFALMGAIFAEEILGVAHPRCGCSRSARSPRRATS